MGAPGRLHGDAPQSEHQISADLKEVLAYLVRVGIETHRLLGHVRLEQLLDAFEDGGVALVTDDRLGKEGRLLSKLEAIEKEMPDSELAIWHCLYDTMRQIGV